MNTTEKNIKVNVTDVTPAKGADSQAVAQCRQRCRQCSQDNLMTTVYTNQPRRFFRSPAFGLQRPGSGLFAPNFGRPESIGAVVTAYALSSLRNPLSFRLSRASDDSDERFIKNIISC